MQYMCIEAGMEEEVQAYVLLGCAVKSSLMVTKLAKDEDDFLVKFFEPCKSGVTVKGVENKCLEEDVRSPNLR